MSKMRKILTDQFNDSELRNLCFELAIDYEDLNGSNRLDKARELVAYCNRHGRFQDLMNQIRLLRPHLFGNSSGA
jgi:hypothetical protein